MPNNRRRRQPAPSSAPPANHDLRALQNSISPTEPLPRLVHVTELGIATQIITARRLETRHCGVFDSHLLYTFVGRPAYRPRNGAHRSDQTSRFPFAFIVATDRLPPPRHVYPHDTGAARAGRYAPAADPHVPWQDYELEPSLEAARRHIAWAFETNARYLRGDVRPSTDFNLANFEWAARSCLAIHRLASSTADRPDDRAAAIEIAFAENLNLADHVKLVILPDRFIEDEGRRNTPFCDALTGLGIPFATYAWQPQTAPNDYLDEIARISEGYVLPVGS